jgi:metal-responsive CopG/Arc/MetJ family transcriptional regulator
MRILVDIGDPQIQVLDAMSKQSKRSRAALIRDAVGEYLSRRRPKQPTAAFGLWGEHGIDGLTYQEKIRAEW